MYTTFAVDMYKKYIALFLILLASDLFSTTCCEQKFDLLGLDTSKTKILYLTETLSGECYCVNLVRLEIREDKILEQVQRYRVEETLEKTQEQVKQEISDKINPTLENPVEFVYQASFWQSPLYDWQIKNPITPPNLLDRIYNNQFINGYIWNRANEESGIVYPEFINNKVLLMYYHPAGLYVDYVIEKIYYFAKVIIY